MKKLALLGAGNVGAATAQVLANRPDIQVEITKVLVRDVSKAREGISSKQLSANPGEVLDSADIIVEVMGGTGLAGDLTLKALQAGKPVISANKAVLAERWQELKPYAEQGLLHYESSVMAGTPAVGPLSSVLRGSSPLELHAILNGTCNYILTELEKGVSYQNALAEAQRLGYAEADPTLDVGGFDAAHKLTVLARLVFDPSIEWETVKASTKGIDKLTPTVMTEAKERGGKIRLLASVYPEGGTWQVKVRPVFLPLDHLMASAASNKNALYFKGDAIGEVFITGAGAGGMATASGVVADLLDVLANRPGPALLKQPAPVPSIQIEALEEI
ncbi:MAG: homoserine dehydrogenase [Trueperaceae bacterium]|nr:homoserine dehydrogenase [Trueperaceae bacterium]